MKTGMLLLHTASVVLVVMLSACGRSEDGALSMQTRNTLADQAEQSGRYAEAAQFYQHAAQEHPHDSALQIAYARALLGSGDLVGARDVVLKALAARPGDRALLRESGVIELKSGNAALGISTFDRLLADDASDWRTLVDKGVALDVSGQHPAAQQLYCRAWQIAPNQASIATDFATSLMLQGNANAARGALDPYFQRFDIPAATRADLAVLYEATNQGNRVGELYSDEAQRANAAALARRLPSTPSASPSCQLKA